MSRIPGFLEMASGEHRELIEASAEAIPLDDSTADTVVTTWTLRTIPDVAMALNKMRRVLKPAVRSSIRVHLCCPRRFRAARSQHCSLAWRFCERLRGFS